MYIYTHIHKQHTQLQMLQEIYFEQRQSDITFYISLYEYSQTQTFLECP